MPSSFHWALLRSCRDVTCCVVHCMERGKAIGPSSRPSISVVKDSLLVLSYLEMKSNKIHKHTKQFRHTQSTFSLLLGLSLSQTRIKTGWPFCEQKNSVAERQHWFFFFFFFAVSNHLKVVAVKLNIQHPSVSHKAQVACWESTCLQTCNDCSHTQIVKGFQITLI